MEKRSRNIFCREKAVGSTNYECESVFLPYVSGMQSACSVLYVMVGRSVKTQLSR
jgi:hypothetical protein